MKNILIYIVGFIGIVMFGLGIYGGIAGGNTFKKEDKERQNLIKDYASSIVNLTSSAISNGVSIDSNWFLSNKQSFLNNGVSCKEMNYDITYGVVLENCEVNDINGYYYVSDKIYTDESKFNKIFVKQNEVPDQIPDKTETTQIYTSIDELMNRYFDSLNGNLTLDESITMYPKGAREQLRNMYTEEKYRQEIEDMAPVSGKHEVKYDNLVPVDNETLKRTESDYNNMYNTSFEFLEGYTLTANINGSDSTFSVCKIKDGTVESWYMLEY